MVYSTKLNIEAEENCSCVKAPIMRAIPERELSHYRYGDALYYHDPSAIFHNLSRRINARQSLVTILKLNGWRA